MRIRSVETFHFVGPVPRPYGPASAYNDVRDSVFVKITTDDGLIGWGETYAIGQARAVIDRELAPLLIGENPLQTRRLWHKLWGLNFGHNFAVSAVDLALHDLRGKAMNLSVADLFGGGFRRRIAAYASGIYYEQGRKPEDHWLDDAARLADEGYRAIKIRIGKQPPERELPLLEKLRAAVPARVQLLADANGAYTLATALHVGHALEQLGFGWFEGPIREDDYAAYEILTDRLTIPVAAGELQPSRLAFHQFLSGRKASILQPDVSTCGGIEELLFVADLARLQRIGCVPHCNAGGVCLAATIHLCALIAEPTTVPGNEAPLLEWEVPRPLFQTDLLVRPFELVDGMVEMPTGPGLGVEIDEDVLRAYSRD
jgi:D-galactarolactone cycloisomerase